MGHSVFRRAIVLLGPGIITTPAATGALPPRTRRRGGTQAPTPMPNGCRESIYRSDRGGALTARQRRRLTHKRNAEAKPAALP